MAILNYHIHGDNYISGDYRLIFYIEGWKKSDIL